MEAEIYRLEKMDERKITDEDLSRAQKLKITSMEQEHLQMRQEHSPRCGDSSKKRKPWQVKSP